ncbi:RNA polymerase sigma factor [Kitasatospora sp. NPDC058218]|uniref:RNA polymerase sigma factor n=1 Tax=Kitasatospora sp. NPDC058218 TaxID=3346385 RepID=UPI0036D8359C
MNDSWDQQTGPDPVAALPRDFEGFFIAWQKKYLKYAETRLRSREDAEDVVIRAAVIIHRKWDRILAHENPIAFTFYILQRLIIDYWRDQTRQAKAEHAARILARDTPVHHPSADLAQFNRLADYEQLDQALDELETHSPVQAACVRLRHLVGMSHDEIAVLLDINSSKAKNETWMGMRFLKARLDRPHQGEGSTP